MAQWNDYVENSNEFKGGSFEKEISLPNNTSKPNQKMLYIWDGGNVEKVGMRVKFQKRECLLDLDGSGKTTVNKCIEKHYREKGDFEPKENVRYNLTGSTEKYYIDLNFESGKNRTFLDQLAYIAKNKISLDNIFMLRGAPSAKDFRYNGIIIYDNEGVQIPFLLGFKEYAKRGAIKNENKILKGKENLKIINELYEIVNTYFNANAAEPEIEKIEYETPPEIAKKQGETIDVEEEDVDQF